MTICFFGIYHSNNLRLNYLKRSLVKLGIKVIECHSEKNGFKKYFDLLVKHWSVKGKYDFMFVAFPGYQSLILAKFLTAKPIIFDAFNSIYDTAVNDRRQVAKYSLTAGYFWILNKLACWLANKIILDTSAHINYFVKKFKISEKKFAKLLVGTDDLIFYPRKGKKISASFIVHFHGSFIPLHGIEYIIKAAKLLEDQDIIFNLVGSGQTYPEMVGLAQSLNLTKVNFLEPLQPPKLAELMARADLCLGIFGSTDKAKRVIPCKVYDALAMAKPVLTGDSPAIRELLHDQENVLLCQLADPEDLAAKIKELKNNQELRQKIAQNGYSIFLEKSRPQILAKDLLKIISR